MSNDYRKDAINRKVKSIYQRMKKCETISEREKLSEEANKLFYYEIKELNDLSKPNLLRAIAIESSLRPIPLHQFLMRVNEEKLK